MGSSAAGSLSGSVALEGSKGQEMVEVFHGIRGTRRQQAGIQRGRNLWIGGAPVGWQPLLALGRELPEVSGALIGKRDGGAVGASQRGTSGGQACPTSSPCCP